MLTPSTTPTGPGWSAASPRSTRSARSPSPPWRAITAGNASAPSSCRAPPTSRCWSYATRVTPAFSRHSTMAVSLRMTFLSADRPVVLPPVFHRSADQDHHGPQHGRQEHPPSAGRCDHHPRADRLLRARFFHAPITRGSHLHSHRRAVRAVEGCEAQRPHPGEPVDVLRGADRDLADPGQLHQGLLPDHRRVG